MSTTPSLGVLVIGDNRLYCEGIAHLLDRDQRCDPVAIAFDAHGALEHLARRPFDIALVDASTAGSVELMRGIALTHARVKVVALGLDEDQDDLLLFAEAGVAGYVPRTASVAELVAVLQSVSHGELPCSPRVAATLLRHVATLAAAVNLRPRDGSRELTPREHEVVQLIAMRLSNKQIGGRLGIEAATVKNHVHHILEKLQAHRRRDIVSLVRASRA